MKKFVLIALPVVLIVLLLASALITPHEDPGDGPNLSSRPGESTGPENPTQPGKPSEPTESPTNPTEAPTKPTVRPTYPTETEKPTVSYWPTEEGVWYNPYPDDHLNLEFSKQYPIQIPVQGNERIRVFVKGVDKREYVTKAIAVYTDEGKRVTRVGEGALYLLEEGGVAKKVGTLGAAGYERVDARIGDGDYEIRIDIELVDIWVSYGHFTPILETDTWRYYDLKGVTSIRLVIPNYDSVLSGAADVKCYVVTKDGEIEITPTDWPYDWEPF